MKIFFYKYFAQYKSFNLFRIKDEKHLGAELIGLVDYDLQPWEIGQIMGGN